MKVTRIEDTVKGWFVGDFPKAAFQSKDFEVSWRIHHAGEAWDLHYQEKAYEINLLISGEMVLNNVKLVSGDVFVLDPFEITDVRFITECSIVCVKTPSLPNDKIIVEKK